MIKKNAGQIIQAFPVTASTYVGTPTAFDPKGYDLVHCNADAQITFDFGTMGTVVIQGVAGQDFAIGDGCVAITATGEVAISQETIMIQGVEISKSVSPGSKPVTKVEVKRSSPRRRKARLVCPVFKGKGKK